VVKKPLLGLPHLLIILLLPVVAVVVQHLVEVEAPAVIEHLHHFP